MHLAVLRLRVRFVDGPRSGRRTARAILEKIHRHFNVSIAEVDRLDHASESVLGVVAVGASRREVREVLDRVADAVSAHPRAEVFSVELNDL